jgi:hypothetical protein
MVVSGSDAIPVRASGMRAASDRKIFSIARSPAYLAADDRVQFPQFSPGNRAGPQAGPKKREGGSKAAFRIVNYAAQFRPDSA